MRDLIRRLALKVNNEAHFTKLKNVLKALQEDNRFDSNTVERIIGEVERRLGRLEKELITVKAWLESNGFN